MLDTVKPTLDPDKASAWKAQVYREELPEDVQPFRDLLQSYSKIPPEEVDDHLHRIRDKLWAVAMYPCIGRWYFTRLKPLDAHPVFRAAVARLTAPGSRDVLLDVACCVGQLARQLVAVAGVPPERVVSTDLVPAFLDLGFELFRDRDRFPPDAFVVADVLDPADEGGKSLEGRATLIHVANFFHLFGWAKQVTAAERLVAFLRPDAAANAVVFGSQIGGVEARTVSLRSEREELFMHDPSSLQRLWDEVGEKTGTRWRVEAAVVGTGPLQMPGVPDDARILEFAIYKI